jgi:Ca2+-binding RTX toxin-like protein
MGVATPHDQKMVIPIERKFIMASIQTVYVALFGRPADPAGLAFFNAATSNGANLTAIGDLAATAEYQSRFTGKSNTQIITDIYMSLFGHAPDAAGLAFFVDALNNGTQNINTIAINIADGAQGADKTLLEKKVAAADLFTAELDTPVEIGNYTGLTAAAKGVAFLTAVTATSPVVDKAAAAAAVADIPTDSGTAGVSITLPAATSVVAPDAADPALRSTAGDDTITAPAYAATNVINAGAGTDKVMATVGAGVTVATDGLKGVEQLFLNDTAGVAVDVENAKELTQVWNNASGNALTVNKMMLSTTAGVKGADSGTTFNFAGATGTSDTATLALDKATNAAGATVIANIETLNVANTGSSKVDLTLADTTKIVATGTGDLQALYTGGAAKLADLDASAMAGGLTTDVSALQAMASLKGGTGADTLTYNTAGNTAALKVDGGAGADTLIETASAGAGFTVELTGGAGPDTFRFGDTQNVATATSADFAKSLITITDFDKASDTIDVKAMGVAAGTDGREVLTNTELANIASKATLFEAAQTAATFIDTAAKHFGVFIYGGDAYILHDDDNSSTFNANDGLIKVTGVTDLADFTATNFLSA